MKNSLNALLALGVLAFGSVVSAATITPDSPLLVTTGTETSQSAIENYITTTFTVDGIYKQDVGGGETGVDFANSYTTTFDNEPLDPQEATITYDGGDSIFCGTCYLLVKDGNQDPSWYLFNLNFWDGTETLNLSNFWPTQGAISHVSIYSANSGRGLEPPAVPIPASVWLFGSGLLGLVGVARRKDTTC